MTTHDAQLKYDYALDATDENNTAAAIHRMVSANGSRVLDLGSGPAIVSSQFAGLPGYRIVCADMDTNALGAALAAGVHEVHEVDLDSSDWFAALPREEFDCIMLADVLEHLRQPQDLLESIVSQGFLAPGGRLVISIPNANHESIVGSLLAGDFAYTETGILDATHVRWFTLDSLSRLLESRGFRIERIHRTTRTLEQTQQSSYALSLSPTARQALGEMGIEGRTLQYVVQASYRGDEVDSPASQREIDEIRVEFDEKSKALLADYRLQAEEAEAAKTNVEEKLNFRLAESQLEISQRDSELASLRALIEEERTAALREFEYLSNELAAHRRNARRLRSQVNEVTSSTSWKVARVLTAAGHPVSSMQKLISRFGPNRKKQSR